jgi:hypothetical protein
MSNEETMEYLRNETENALSMKSRDLMYRTLSMVYMAARLGAINYEQLMEFHNRLMYDGIQELDLAMLYE